MPSSMMCTIRAVVLSAHTLQAFGKSDTMVEINGDMDVTVLSTDIMDEPTFPAHYADESDAILQITGHRDAKVPGTDMKESAFPAPDTVIDKTEAMLQNGGHMDANTTITWMRSQIHSHISEVCPKPNGCAFDGRFPAPYLTSDWDCRPCSPTQNHPDPWAVNTASRRLTKEQLVGGGCCKLRKDSPSARNIRHCGCGDCWWGHPWETARQPYTRAHVHNEGACADACKQDRDCYWAIWTPAFVANPWGCFLYRSAPDHMWEHHSQVKSVAQFCFTKSHWATNVQYDCKWTYWRGKNHKVCLRNGRWAAAELVLPATR